MRPRGYRVEGLSCWMAAWLDANGGMENSDLDPFEDRLIEQWQALAIRG